MWLVALGGRLAYFLHLASGHAVTWNRPPTDASLCAGDIVCHECGEVLWCRAHDPWRPPARVDAPPDHRPDTRANWSESTLFDSLQSVLRLAEECPSGPFGDAIRRGACELVEADSWRSRSMCRRRLLKSVAHLQWQQLHGEARTDDPTPLMLKRLGEALQRPRISEEIRVETTALTSEIGAADGHG